MDFQQIADLIHAYADAKTCLGLIMMRHKAKKSEREYAHDAAVTMLKLKQEYTRLAEQNAYMKHALTMITCESLNAEGYAQDALDHINGILPE